jgi:rod shape-determining protein MreC
VPSRRFVQAKPFLTLGLLVLAWLVVPTVIKRFTRLTFFELQAPVEVAASYARDLQDYWSMRTRSKNELIAAYRELGGLTARYAGAAEENASLRHEIARLESLLRLPSFSDYRSEPARVVRRDTSGWWQQLVIRKGRNHGIVVGAPVIFIGGVVGRVREVNAYTSIVDLISSPHMRLAAAFEGDDRPVSFQGGDNAPFSAPQATVEFVSLDIFASSPTRNRWSPPVSAACSRAASNWGRRATGAVHRRVVQDRPSGPGSAAQPADGSDRAHSARSPVTVSLAHRRTLVLFACGFVLWLLIAQANHYLAPARLYIWVGGLFVTFAALRLPAQEGFNASFLIGLLLDAASPVPFGLHAFLFGIAHLVLFGSAIASRAT